MLIALKLRVSKRLFVIADKTWWVIPIELTLRHILLFSDDLSKVSFVCFFEVYFANLAILLVHQPLLETLFESWNGVEIR